MAEHYEFLIEHAAGQWMTTIGDDDALMPYFFESLEKITSQSQEIGIISSARAYYFWRGCTPEHGDYAVRYKSSPRQEMRSTKKDLLLALLGLKSCFDLPQLYTTCIIKRDWVQSLKRNQGGYMYHSIIPDMYSAVALAMNFDSYLRIDKPLFWVGTSNKSMGLSTRIYEDSKQNVSIKKDRLFLNPDIPQEIHAAGFGQMYLYECLLQYPVKNKSFLNKKITIIFIMGSILKQIKLAKYNIKISQESLVAAFRQYIGTLQLSYISVRIASIFLNPSNIFCKVSRYSFVLWIYLCSRFNIKNYVYFLSKDHDAFSSIEYASRFVKKYD